MLATLQPGLDRIVRSALLGVQFRDAVDGRVVAEGLDVQIQDLWQPGRRLAMTANRGGIFAPHAFAGMRGFGDDGPASGPVSPGEPARFHLSARDTLGRYLPVSLAPELPSPGLWSPGGAWASPPDAAAHVPLFSAATRVLPAAMASLRAELRRASQPALIARRPSRRLRVGGHAARLLAGHAPRRHGARLRHRDGPARSRAAAVGGARCSPARAAAARRRDPAGRPAAIFVRVRRGIDPQESPMPEYLAPGVFVEETSFRAKSIEGVSTTTTGFIGPAAYGPVTLEPDIITSLTEYERVYDPFRPGAELEFEDMGTAPNHLWHGVRAFFTEGGKRLYVSRVFKPTSGEYEPLGDSDDLVFPAVASAYADGHARENSIRGRAQRPACEAAGATLRATNSIGTCGWLPPSVCMTKRTSSPARRPR
jgi:hypothetical protein